MPPPGSAANIVGVAIHTPQSPASYAAVAFTVDAAGNYWGPKAQATPGADGTFSIASELCVCDNE